MTLPLSPFPIGGALLAWRLDRDIHAPGWDSGEGAYRVYGKYRYSKQASTSLMEFKARNGFEEVLMPRYYVPLTARGAAAVKLKLYRGFSELVPAFALDLARNARGAWYRAKPPLASHRPV